MRIRVLLIVLLITSFGFAKNLGTITGILKDKNSTNKTLSNATVAIKGTDISTNTDSEGKYTLYVGAGEYVVEFSLPGYETTVVIVTVKEGETTIINETLVSASYNLKEVVIKSTRNKEKSTALLLDQKNAAAIKQSIGAQELSTKGISDVEEGLTKITGISKVESKGLFIRGLEDRYNNLLLNNLAVPSNSPFKKIIPLDQFPTDVVSFMDVYKTFNANLYGDFAGATIDVTTSQPTGSQTKISIGTGFTTNNNLSDFLISSDATNSKSFFGFGGQERTMPNAYGTIPSARISNDYQSTWDVTKKQAPLNTSFGVSHTDKFEIGDNKLYYNFATNFDNKYQIRDGVDRTFSQGQGIYDNNLNRVQYKFSTQSSILFGLQYKSNRLNVFTNSLYLKSTENSIQDQLGYTRTAIQNPNEFIRLNQYEESQYFTNQLFGNYKITADDKHSVNGGISYTRTNYNQPDRKFVTGRKINETQVETQYGGNNLIRQFFNINNNFHFSGKLEYNLKFGKNEDKQNKLSVGYNGFAEYMISKFRFAFGKPNGASIPTIVNINEIESTIQSDVTSNKMYFQEESSSEYKTKVFQRADGIYTNMLVHWNDKLEINTGIRAENTIREYKFRTISDPISSPYRKKIVEKLYILPSLNLKYVASEKSNIRFTASKTYTKPVLFESLDINLINADGTTERGNSDLINSENYNADLKFEIFPTSKELFAATVFAKYIDNPIERTVQSSATGSGQTITYFNNKSAQLFGAEFEFLVQLSRINDNLKGLSFGFNTSLMFTEATVNKNRSGYFDTFEKRKLQGASDWLVNSDIKYEFNSGHSWKNTASLVYSVYGERIFAVGIAGYDHIYEKPFHKLDLVWNSAINKKWNFKFSVDNILDPIYKRELGTNNKISIDEASYLLQSYRRGIGFSSNLTYSF